jgi:CBS domain-containing protein
MPDAFAFDSTPFDALTPAERVRLQQACERRSFDAETAVLAAGHEASHAFVLVSGHLREVEAGEETAIHGPGALVGAHAMLVGRPSGTITALDAAQAIAIPRETMQALMAANAQFSARVYAGLADRLDEDARSGSQREFVSLMTMRVKDAYVRKPFFVDAGLDLVSVCRLLAEQRQTSALVRDGDRLGMFTTTDLRDALLLARPPSEVAVREVAQFDLVAVDAEQELFVALLMMVRHRVHRLAVLGAGEVVGVLGQIDLMSFVSNHSHLIALQIEQATSLQDLKTAAQRVDGLLAVLHAGGIKIELIAGMVSALNTRLFARLWAMLAPPELVANSCLLVMGSEGRGEQILKTDQDNALLLRDGFEFPGLATFAARFSAALSEIGYPPCPGDIMVTNPLWRQPLAGFRDSIRDWLYGSDPEGPMRLAIFFDAAAVAGDASLLVQARSWLDTILSDNDAFLARFASAADQFLEPGGWWSRLTTRRDQQPLDLKKFGTFPIVHGVRALSLQYRVREAGTTQRLRALVEQGRIPEPMAGDLLEALHFLMALKLKHQLRQRQLGQPATNLVRAADLSTLERDQFKDSLAIIKSFRAFLHQHFRLGAL